MHETLPRRLCHKFILYIFDIIYAMRHAEQSKGQKYRDTLDMSAYDETVVLKAGHTPIDATCTRTGSCALNRWRDILVAYHNWITDITLGGLEWNLRRIIAWCIDCSAVSKTLEKQWLRIRYYEKWGSYCFVYEYGCKGPIHYWKELRELRWNYANYVYNP